MYTIKEVVVGQRMSDRRFEKFRKDRSVYRQRLKSCVSDAGMQPLYLRVASRYRR